MRTETFEKVKPSPITEKYIDSQDLLPQLNALREQLEISVRYDGVRKYFRDDKDERQVITVKIKRGRAEIEFELGLSIRDTEYLEPKSFDWQGRNFINGKEYHKAYEYTRELKKGKQRVIDELEYSILACCRSEFYVPISFTDFCGEFGYSDDSIKAKETWEGCLEQYSKLHRIFTQEDIDLLPS